MYINYMASRSGDIVVIKQLIGLILGEPCISRKNATTVAFAIIYKEIQINGMSVMHSQKFSLKIR